MKFQDILFPVIALPIGIAFLTICVLVYLNHGKNGRLIAAKLKIGAFLLNLSWFTVSCTTNDEEADADILCYELALLQNSIYLYKEIDSLKTGDYLKLSIFYPGYNYFSFFMIDSITTKVVQSGNIMTTDGSFNKSYIVPDPALPSGGYFLDIYGEENEKINKSMFIERFSIHIQK